MKKLVLVAASFLVPLALLGSGALYLYFTPYFALQEIERAARAGDTASLAQRIDFPAVRSSVKRQIVARIEAGAAANPNPLAAFGSALAGALSDPAVDALLTPDNVARLLRGESLGAVQGPTLHLDTSNVDLEYIGFNRFQAVTAPAPAGFTLVLARQGWLDWKLVEVILPQSWSFRGA
ncbi:MAG TPA: DUF2939 domain-containing protein [Polyangiaceae bacterium]